ncbi:MAG TPA: signal peptide peptidase SppA, partial [Candidatus Krumholzibacteria bacterium]|nr:signal peptide peptidase SppA [Candidatus Krumholzibacteria bacterium]
GALSDASRWGTFLGLEGIGFGFVHNKAQLPEGERSITDYRIGLGGGTNMFTTGVGYAWSGGDTDSFGREKFFQLGLTGRFNRYLSLGANVNLSTESGAHQELFDLGVRPLGDDRLTVFGDIEIAYQDGDRIDTTPWSAGAMLEIPAGLKIVGRYFDDDADGNRGFTVGLAYSFGAGFNQGVARGSWMPRFDDDSELALTNWGVRMGFPERSNLLNPLLEGSGYLDMHLKGSPPYRRYRFLDSRRTFREVLTALEGARTDDRVAGVALNLSGARLSRGQAWEIRQRLEELQATGKKVVVFVDEFGMSTYYVASAADHIVMDPEGLALLPGYVLGRTYVANMAEKLGLGIEEWRFLKYKSAMESLVRHEMSEADREQRQALVDQYYATMREGLAAGRGVSEDTVDRWLNEDVMFIAQRALDENLVDELGRWDELKDAVKKLEDRKVQFVQAGQLANVWYPSKQWGEIPEIAVVYAIGACAMDDGIEARELEKILRRLRGDRGVKAVVLRVDSPGGSPVASDVVASQLRRIMEKKPVVVSQGDVAASGGYWLSMCSNVIVAQPTTITGSIGVISGWVWDKGIGEKVGMEGDFVEAGEHADLFYALKPPLLPVAIPHRAVTDEEREQALDGMKSMYAGFVKAVAKNRKMSEEKVEALAQGRVWTGIEAKSNGLVDRIGGLHDAVMIARELAGISPGDEAEVREYGPKGLVRWKLPTPSLSAPFASIGSISNGATEILLARWLLGADSAGREEAAEATDGTYLDDYNLLYLRRLVQNNGRAQCMLPPDAIPQDGSRGGR